MSNLQLDHLFCFVDESGPEVASLSDAGLVETYRRTHPGQGTANVCFCFDNAYLELIWSSNLDELKRSPLARGRLPERAAWRQTGASPFGIAVRRSANLNLPWTTWDYRPPYLADLSMPVSTCGDDPNQPFIFVSPATERPDEWGEDRAGSRQRSAGLREIVELELRLPHRIEPHPDVLASAARGLFQLGTNDSARHQVILTVSKADGGTRRLSLPDFGWL